jgi:hypothetical protein
MRDVNSSPVMFGRCLVLAGAAPVARQEPLELLEDYDHKNSPGYIGTHNRKIELWFSNVRLEKIAVENAKVGL